MKQYLGIDVGGTFIKYGVMDAQYRIRSKGEVPTPLKSMDQLLDSFASIYRSCGEPIAGVGISFTATMDASNDGYCFGGALDQYTEGKKVLPLFQSLFALPTAVENDGNCFAMGELASGELKDCEHGVVVGLGTGIAGGIVINRRIYRGKWSCAAEFSYMLTNMDRKEAWHEINGANGLLREIRLLKQRPDLDGKHFFAYARQGDADAVRILDAYTSRLTVQLYNLQCVLAPDKIVIGGGISRDPLLMESLYRNLHEFYETHRGLPQANVVKSSLGNDANLIGAVYNLRENN
jgi:predicted NBD/HSP70 family sugar kinase